VNKSNIEPKTVYIIKDRAAVSRKSPGLPHPKINLYIGKMSNSKIIKKNNKSADRNASRTRISVNSK